MVEGKETKKEMRYVYKEGKSLLTYGSPMVIFAIFTVILIRLVLQQEG